MIDLRQIRLGIAIGETMQWYQDLRIHASGTKYANPLQNDCTVTVDGLNSERRDVILTQASPYQHRSRPLRLILEAGRRSTGLFTLFMGDVVSAEIASPPDVSLTLNAKTNHASALNVISTAGEPTQKLSDIAQNVAESCGVTLDFQATDKRIANWYFCGAASAQVQRLQQLGEVSAFIDDAVLIVKDRDKARRGRLRLLSLDSGLVGLPKATEKGLEVRCLIDGETLLGGLLRLDSRINPALNGDYIIEQLKFDIATHDDPFFYQAFCKRA